MTDSFSTSLSFPAGCPGSPFKTLGQQREEVWANTRSAWCHTTTQSQKGREETWLAFDFYRYHHLVFHVKRGVSSCSSLCLTTSFRITLPLMVAWCMLVAKCISLYLLATLEKEAYVYYNVAMYMACKYVATKNPAPFLLSILALLFGILSQQYHSSRSLSLEDLYLLHYLLFFLCIKNVMMP